MKKKPFHVYAEDGFEDAYASERSARTHARQGSKQRSMIYRVVMVGLDGFTGGGHGRILGQFRNGKEEKVPE